MTTMILDRKVVIFLKKSVQIPSNKIKGFTLVELVVVIAIMFVFTLIVLRLVNPLELAKQSRDQTRIGDLASLVAAITVVTQQSTKSGVLCNGVSGACSGDSTKGTRAADGTGWLKINLSGEKNAPVTELPSDPINNSTYKYTYGVNSAGTGYEIDAVMESRLFSTKMTEDGGRDNNHYEVGTDLTAIAP